MKPGKPKTKDHRCTKKSQSVKVYQNIINLNLCAYMRERERESCLEVSEHWAKNKMIDNLMGFLQGRLFIFFHRDRDRDRVVLVY